MDTNAPFNGNLGPEARVIKLNLFTIAALICTMLAFLMVLTGLMPIFFGSFAIIFAVLSKGKEMKMNRLARSAVSGSIISILLGIVLTVAAVYTIISDPKAREIYDQTFEQNTGMTIEEYLHKTGITLGEP